VNPPPAPLKASYQAGGAKPLIYSTKHPILLDVELDNHIDPVIDQNLIILLKMILTMLFNSSM
jgi:hypothetical protein